MSRPALQAIDGPQLAPELRPFGVAAKLEQSGARNPTDIGADEAARWQRIVIDGELFTPGEHAFGPCYDRKAATYTFDGRPFDGYQWVRVASVPDAKCLAW